MKNFYKELPEGYELIKVVDAKTKSFSRFMNIGSLILTIIVCALTMIIKKVKFPFTDDIPYLLMSVAIFIILLFGSIITHELLHGLAYKVLTKEKLTFGFNMTVAFCGVPNIYVSKKTALISLLAPFVIINSLYIISLFFLPNTILGIYIILCFGIHFGGCIGDLYDTYLLLFKLRGKVLMNDTGPKQSFYVLKEGEK